MNFDVFLLCGTGVGVLFLLLPIKELRGNTFAMSTVALSLVITAYTLRGAVPLFSYFNTFYSTDMSVYFKVLTKALGISLICTLTSDMTADLGMNTLSGKVEFAGKLAILLSAMPLFDTLLSHVEKFI